MAELIDREVLIKHIRQYKTVYGTPMTKRDEQVVHYIIGHIKNLELTTTEAEIRAKAIEEFLQEIDKAIIDRKAHSLKPNSVILDHVNDFDEVKRETLHKIAEQLKGE